MILVELSKLVRRPRTWVTIGLLAGLPVVVGIFIKASGLAPAPGEGPALLSEVFNNGLLFPAAALAIVLPLFLPIAVSVIGGDAIAGEAANGTLRYLLTRPVGRTHLLVAKLIALIAFIFVAVVTVALVALAAGVALFGIEPLSSISATPYSTESHTASASSCQPSGRSAAEPPTRKKLWFIRRPVTFSKNPNTSSRSRQP